MASIPVLHIADTFSYGGTEKTMQILCAALQQRGSFEVHAGVWNSGGSREDWVKEHVAHVVSFHRSAEQLTRYIREYRIRIVHVHRSNHQMLAVLRVLAQISDIRVIETNAFGKITTDPVESVVAIRAFVSAFCADRFRKAHPEQDEQIFLSTSVVLYNPIDPNDFPEYSSEYTSAFKRSLGIRDEERVITRVGRADDNKFGDMCVLMMPYLLKKNPHVRLVLQSAPSRIERFVRKHTLSEQVIILPETADTKALGLLYAATDVAVHSSLIGESFGCSLAESMMYRKPVVVNTTPYFDNAQIEVVDNNSTGYIVDNPESFAEAVHQLLSKDALRIQYGERGYQKAMRLYSVGHVVTQLETIYARMLSRASVADIFPQDMIASLPAREHDIFAPRPFAYTYYRLRNIVQKRYFALRSRL
jgi:glycosyltransferase involved in cell wall biosynthesis